MQYHSTRNDQVFVDSAQAVLSGLAPDGGLYMPREIPEFDWKTCLTKDAQGMSAMILKSLLPDIPEMDELVRKAYTGKFETEDLTPTVSVGDYTVLELFRGPTSAFKDVALCMLPQLLTAAKTVKGEEKDIMILTATSGDTGKAALEGFKDVPGTRITVFYPHGGVSQVQRAQMVTQEGNNVRVCAVEGNFDDAQTGVKMIFNNCQGKELPFALSSANSINIGRLAPQIMYYFKAYRDLMDAGKIDLGDQVNFSVPTGNFGDILAGYMAKLLGLPVGRLICASNRNKVLEDFLNTGVYDRARPLHKTISPSMDILVSSNLERLLYLMSGDSALVASLMHQLNTAGSYQVPAELLDKIQSQFWGFHCGDVRATVNIGRCWKQHRYLLDPHTATAWVAAECYSRRTEDDRPMVILSTASPYKFPHAVLCAIQRDPIVGDEYAQMEQLQTLTGVPIPKNLATLQGRSERHTGVIPKDQMQAFVLEQ